MAKKNKYSLNINDFLHLTDTCNVYWLDKDNHILDFNDTQFQMMKDLIGIKSRQELIGKYLLDYLPSDIGKIFVDENKLVMQTRCAHQFFNIVKYKEKNAIILLTIKTPLYDENGQIAGVFGISQHLAIHSFESVIKEFLTKREYECLFLLLKGKTAQEIATELHLSRRSIESYISHTKTKLDCKTKSELIHKVYEIGLSILMIRDNAVSRKFEPGYFMPFVASYPHLKKK